MQSINSHRQTCRMIRRDFAQCFRYDCTLKGNGQLAEKGWVVVEDYWTAERCESVLYGISELISRHPSPSAAGYMLDSGTEITQRHSNDGRKNYDTGMYDIFNAHLEVEMYGYEGDTGILNLVNQAAGRKMQCSSTNIYSNQSVLDPRAYHADVLGKDVYKSFLYLTDVPDASYGPYSFIEASHKPNIYRYANLLFNQTMGFPKADMRIYGHLKPIIFTAQRGTLIITNQRGFHRGLPQAEGRERCLITNHYKAADV